MPIPMPHAPSLAKLNAFLSIIWEENSILKKSQHILVEDSDGDGERMRIKPKSPENSAQYNAGINATIRPELFEHGGPDNGRKRIEQFWERYKISLCLHKDLRNHSFDTICSPTLSAA